MASSLSLDLNTKFSSILLEIYWMQSSFAMCLSRSDELWVYDLDYLLTIFDSSLNSFMYDWFPLQVSSDYRFGLAY